MKTSDKCRAAYSFLELSFGNLTVGAKKCFLSYAKVMCCIGPLHTRHICLQYYDIAIKKICNKKIILRHRFLLTNQGKLFKIHTLIWVLFMYLDLFFCQELTLAFRHLYLKIIFLSQYLFYRNIACKNI